MPPVSPRTEDLVRLTREVNGIASKLRLNHHLLRHLDHREEQGFLQESKRERFELERESLRINFRVLNEIKNTKEIQFVRTHDHPAIARLVNVIFPNAAPEGSLYLRSLLFLREGLS